MKKLLLMTATGLLFLSCKKELVQTQIEESERIRLIKGAALVSVRTSGATQISGVGYYDATDVCNSQEQGATYALTLTGDLAGCFYIFVDEYKCSPSGTYREKGRDFFVGTYKGQSGSFWMNYNFESKYEGCAEDGSYLGLEIFGRCQHPIIEGSGTGVFEGVSGRMDFKDDIEAGDFPYRGHFQF